MTLWIACPSLLGGLLLGSLGAAWTALPWVKKMRQKRMGINRLKATAGLVILRPRLGGRGRLLRRCGERLICRAGVMPHLLRDFVGARPGAFACGLRDVGGRGDEILRPDILVRTCAAGPATQARGVGDCNLVGAPLFPPFLFIPHAEGGDMTLLSLQKPIGQEGAFKTFYPELT